MKNIVIDAQIPIFERILFSNKPHPSMAINVLVISNYRDYHTARPEARIFMGLAKYDFNIHVMTYPGTELQKEFEAVGIKVITWHPEYKRNRQEIKKLRDYIIENKIDIVHLFNSRAIQTGIQAAKKLPVKVVLYRGYTGNIHWYDPTAYLKYLHPRVDRVFCNSIGVEQLIRRQKFWKTNVPVTINKGHDLAWYEGYQPLDIKKELGIPEDAFLLVNVANNRKMKGIPYLLKAMNLLPADANIHLLLIGRDMDDPKHLKIIEAGDKKDKIHILGFRKDVLNIVAACDTFVLSSIIGESITKSVLEAMSLGVAPIITDIPGNVELVEPGKNGLVVPMKKPAAMAQAIMQLFNNRELCKTMGQASKNRIKNVLNTENTVAKTKKMYEDLMK